MDILRILDLVIGIIFIYFILSIVASATLEIVANFFMFRANDLRDWVYSTFDKPYHYRKPNLIKRIFIKLKKAYFDITGKKTLCEPKCLGEEIWHHFVVDGLSRAGKKVSYIPSSEFVRALFDIVVSVKLVDAKDENKIIDRIKLIDNYGEPKIYLIDECCSNNVNKNKEDLPEFKIKKFRDLTPKNYSIDELKEAVIKSPFLSNDQAATILQYLRDSDNIYEVRKNFEIWFDKAMERLTGDYKRFSQRFLFFNGMFIAFLFNVDTIAITNYLYANPDKSTEFANIVSNSLNDPKFNQAIQNLNSRDININQASQDTIKAKISHLKLINNTLTDPTFPLGWKKEELQFATKDSLLNNSSSIKNPISKFCGILITGFALSLGATFWFDLLNKLVNLRSAGRKPEEINDLDAVG